MTPANEKSNPFAGLGREIPVALLKEYFAYRDGRLERIKAYGRMPLGPVHETISEGRGGRPYKTVSINGLHVLLHRLVWCLEEGSWPTHVIDHINNDPLDNRRCNLRPATVQENSRNQDGHKRRASKWKGVYKDRKSKGYFSSIRVGHRNVHLGTFPTELDAAIAYNASAIKNYGEFARLNYV